MPVRAPLERRRVVLVVAVVIALLVFVTREASTEVSATVAALFAIPVTLVSLELGPGAGFIASASGLALAGLWMLSGRLGFNAPALVFGGVALAGVAAISGRFSSRMFDARRHQQQLLTSGLELAGRAEHDSLPLAIAQRALELVPARGVEVAIDHDQPVRLGTLDGEQLRLALRAGATELGTITVANPASRPFSPDEQIVLEMLGLQAAIAAENDRLLVLQREQTTLHTELSTAHGQLAEQGRRLGLLLHTQETERTEIARELHDQTAQALAAIQLGLRAVEHDLSSEPSRAHVEYLRATLSETLHAVRELAVGLHPAVLDELGLEPALRGLAARSGEASGHPITIELERLERVPVALQTTVYRLVDDMISALGGAIEIRIGPSPAGDELRIEAIRSAPERRSAPSPALLARIRARLDISAGALQLRADDHHRLVASIPLDAVTQV